MESKSLIYIANVRMPTEKAYGIQITKMCEAFARQGLTVKLFFPERHNGIKTDVFEYYGVERNFSAIKINAPDFYFPGAWDKLAAMLKGIISAIMLVWAVRGYKADIIYTRDEFIAVLFWLTGRKTALEVHRYSDSRSLLYGYIFSKQIPVIAISRGVKKDFEKAGFPADKILVVPDGVDMDKFSLNITEAEARQKIGLPDNSKIVLYSGHLFPWKGADILAEAAKLMPETTFVFVGGVESDIHKFRQKYGSQKNIIITGHKPHNAIPYYLKAADVLVLPNKSDGGISSFYTSPLKLFEYMASGRPIVASDLPSIREILDENNSIPVRPDNPEALAHGIKKLLSEKVLSEKLAQKAFQDVQQYSWQNRAEKILKFIQ